MIFILGSPRTGSTLIYQIMIDFYNLSYFTNLTNDYFYKHPFLGSLLSTPFIKAVGFESDHGKTEGLLGPSEGSCVFKNWFGSDNEILPGKADHMVNTFKNIRRFIRQPVVMKNAWNCFRIESLSKLFPEAMFIWIRRDIVASAHSDLESRYLRGGPLVWNSAPTPNCAEIQEKPYWEQVVEQQYTYNEIIRTDLDRFYPNNYMELWYEDLCNDLTNQMNMISDFFFGSRGIVTSLPKFGVERHFTNEDLIKIRKYVGGNTNKFKEYVK